MLNQDQSKIKIPEYAIALIEHIRLVAEREYWNRYADSINLQFEIINNNYFKSIPVNEGNYGFIEFSEITIKFPAYLSKDMYSNKELSLEEWVKWFENFIKILRDPKVNFKI